MRLVRPNRLRITIATIRRAAHSEGSPFWNPARHVPPRSVAPPVAVGQQKNRRSKTTPRTPTTTRLATTGDDGGERQPKQHKAAGDVGDLSKFEKRQAVRHRHRYVATVPPAPKNGYCWTPKLPVKLCMLIGGVVSRSLRREQNNYTAPHPKTNLVSQNVFPYFNLLIILTDFYTI